MKLRVSERVPALRGMLVYNLLAAFFVGYLWFTHQLVGKLLLPAFVLHAVLSILLVWVWLRQKSSSTETAPNTHAP